MKRVGRLMPLIADLDNLREAFLRAARGKSTRGVVIAYRDNLELNLKTMRNKLLNGTFEFGNYNFFTIYDPKEREICAASFVERVAFHAIMRICHPVFDDYQIFDSYASRIGKGTYAALDRARNYAKRYRWFAKLDVVKFFDLIDHIVLKLQLYKLFKDPMLLSYFDQLIESYGDSRGVPIGNLTSQYFANHYLSPADHFAKQQLHVPGFVRYMDDVLFFGNDRDQLLSQVKEYQQYVKDTLLLSHHPLVMNNVSFGIPFLGYVVYAHRMRLNLRSKRRFASKMHILNGKVQSNLISQEEYATRVGCLLAFVDKADCVGFKHKVFSIQGM